MTGNRHRDDFVISTAEVTCNPVRNMVTVEVLTADRVGASPPTSLNSFAYVNQNQIVSLSTEFFTPLSSHHVIGGFIRDGTIETSGEYFYPAGSNRSGWTDTCYL
jgi:hypothetical protein